MTEKDAPRHTRNRARLTLMTGAVAALGLGLVACGDDDTLPGGAPGGGGGTGGGITGGGGLGGAGTAGSVGTAGSGGGGSTATGGSASVDANVADIDHSAYSLAANIQGTGFSNTVTDQWTWFGSDTYPSDMTPSIVDSPSWPTAHSFTSAL